MEALEEVIKESIKQMRKGFAENIIGIGVDTTGSRPAPVDSYGIVPSLKEEFNDNPNAMFILWKGHTAIDEAEHINKITKSWGGIDFTKYYGDVYFSERFFSKDHMF